MTIAPLYAPRTCSLAPHVALIETGAIAGFRWSLWVVAAALAAQGVCDLTHGAFFVNPGVPAWWPAFCLAYDVTAAACLAWLLTSARVRASAGIE